jgi:hypothetical protein
MIKIQGFNTKQRILADLVWNMGSKEAVDKFISTLPTNDARDARVVVDMILLAFIDDVAEIQQGTVDLLDTFRV